MGELSPQYFVCLEESKRHHRTSPTFSGELTLPHAFPIREIIRRLGIKSILDYGCGKGIQYERQHAIVGGRLEQFWGVPVTKYDPAWPPYERKPKGKFDLVICTHVLGSIPKVDLAEIVNRVYGRANKAVYFGEIIGPVKKKVFAKPELMPIGWSEQQWMDALRRETTLDVTISFQSNIEGGPPHRWVRLREGQFVAAGGVIGKAPDVTL